VPSKWHDPTPRWRRSARGSGQHHRTRACESHATVARRSGCGRHDRQRCRAHQGISSHGAQTPKPFRGVPIVTLSFIFHDRARPAYGNAAAAASILLPAVYVNDCAHSNFQTTASSRTSNRHGLAQHRSTQLRVPRGREPSRRCRSVGRGRCLQHLPNPSQHL
jgi:hypothetical protein